LALRERAAAIDANGSGDVDEAGPIERLAALAAVAARTTLATVAALAALAALAACALATSAVKPEGDRQQGRSTARREREGTDDSEGRQEPNHHGELYREGLAVRTDLSGRGDGGACLA
jgi:hypothetical protein